MTKQDTLKLKGIALLMMVAMHTQTSLTQHIFCIGDYALWDVIAKMLHPVEFFLFLSGYGLRYVYEHGDAHHYGRLMKLFVHYWAITIIFVTIGGIVIGTDIFPGNFYKIVENITTFHTSYNGPCWFFFPFVAISFSYPCIFRLMDKVGGGGMMILSFLVYLASGYVISRYHWTYCTAPHLPYNLMQILFLQFSFILGAMLKKYQLLERINEFNVKKVWRFLLSVTLIAIPTMVGRVIHTTAFSPFLAIILFVGCFLLVVKHRCHLLQLIGHHSMNIWMIHWFIMGTIFKTEIYRLHYTALVFLAAVALSLVASSLINAMVKNIDNWIYTKKI